MPPLLLPGVSPPPSSDDSALLIDDRLRSRPCPCPCPEPPAAGILGGCLASACVCCSVILAVVPLSYIYAPCIESMPVPVTIYTRAVQCSAPRVKPRTAHRPATATARTGETREHGGQVWCTGAGANRGPAAGFPETAARLCSAQLSRTRLATSFPHSATMCWCWGVSLWVARPSPRCVPSLRVSPTVPLANCFRGMEHCVLYTRRSPCGRTALATVCITVCPPHCTSIRVLYVQLLGWMLAPGHGVLQSLVYTISLRFGVVYIMHCTSERGIYDTPIELCSDILGIYCTDYYICTIYTICTYVLCPCAHVPMCPYAHTPYAHTLHTHMHIPFTVANMCSTRTSTTSGTIPPRNGHQRYPNARGQWNSPHCGVRVHTPHGICNDCHAGRCSEPLIMQQAREFGGNG